MTILLREEIRFRDLKPNVPLADDPNVLTLYAEDIANITVHGENFTTMYCEWASTGGGILMRIPVVRLIRPLSSLFDMREVVTEMLDGRSLSSH